MKHHMCPSKFKLTTILFSLAIFSCGCSSTYSVRSTDVEGSYTYGKMNEELKGQEVKIELKDGRDITARDVTISDDSATWVDARAKEKSKASLRQINKIVNKKTFVGGLEWMGIGLAVGGALGATALSGFPGTAESGSQTNSAGIVVGMGAGTVLGFFTGMNVGHSYNYVFPTIEQRDSVQNGK